VKIKGQKNSGVKKEQLTGVKVSWRVGHMSSSRLYRKETAAECSIAIISPNHFGVDKGESKILGYSISERVYGILRRQREAGD